MIIVYDLYLCYWYIFTFSNWLINGIIPCMSIKSHFSFCTMVSTTIVVPDKQGVCTIIHLLWVSPNYIFHAYALWTNIVDI
mgnify:CR=1 FL=1